VEVLDNLNVTFGSSSNYTVISSPTSVNGYLVPDNSYNGSANANLVQSGSQLSVGATDTIYLKVKYFSPHIITFTNSAVAYGNEIPGGGFRGHDVSTNGINPDLNNNNSARDEGEDLPTVFEPSEDFEIPQGFSPNGDGVNDKFEIKGITDYPNLEVSILNRWGNLVYSNSQYDNSWDGKCNEGVQFGGTDLPEGTYFYIISPGKDQKPIKGYVYLNRSVR
jgi:gliding motility-associated-like protein